MFLHKKCASHFYRETIVWISHYFLTRIGLSKWRVNWNYDLQVAMPSRGLHVIGTFAVYDLHIWVQNLNIHFNTRYFVPILFSLCFAKQLTTGCFSKKWNNNFTDLSFFEDKMYSESEKEKPKISSGLLRYGNQFFWN